MVVRCTVLRNYNESDDNDGEDDDENTVEE
jgi:hypothetical protein